ncbi:hypothetical protein [Pollutibacter soli]|uniref:hypothetical protein n=1 Tax=Pollutibacter soli TaxID=3034157 RepID=UPI0030134C38
MKFQPAQELTDLLCTHVNAQLILLMTIIDRETMADLTSQEFHIHCPDVLLSDK